MARRLPSAPSNGNDRQRRALQDPYQRAALATGGERHNRTGRWCGVVLGRTALKLWIIPIPRKALFAARQQHSAMSDVLFSYCYCVYQWWRYPINAVYCRHGKTTERRYQKEEVALAKDREAPRGKVEDARRTKGEEGVLGGYTE